MAYRTLEDLRSELRARLGYAATGALAGLNQSTLNSFLQSAQEILYWTHDWARLRAYTDKTLGVDQYLTDYPTDANPDRITAIAVEDNGVWTKPLKKGIPPELYTTQDNTSRPWRWEPYEQIETFPKNNTERTMRIFYIKALARFTQNTDRATIDDRLIFVHALGDAKEHYRQPGWQSAAAARDALIIKLKAKNWGQDVFNPNEYADEPLAKPQVV